MKEYNNITDARQARETSRKLHIEMGHPNIKKNIYQIENGKYIVCMPGKAKLVARNINPID